VKRWLLATMVFILVLCILMIVVSPYVDLPLTTVRICLAAVLFAQGVLLGGILREPVLFLISTRMYLRRSSRPSYGTRSNFQPLLCVYLC